MEILIAAAILLAAGAAYFFVVKPRKNKAKASQPAPGPDSYTPVPLPDPDPAPASPNAGNDMGPDSQGRIRIPEVEALGGDWARCWWYAPWVLRKPRNFLDAVLWQIRWACGCDADGNLGPAPNRGFDDGKGGMTPYSWLVPRKYVHGIDRYGRDIVFQASSADTVAPDGTIHQARQLGEPVRITDKLTRATRAKNGADLAAYLKAHPDIQPIPEAGPGDGSGDQFS